MALLGLVEVIEKPWDHSSTLSRVSCPSPCPLQRECKQRTRADFGREIEESWVERT